MMTLSTLSSVLGALGLIKLKIMLSMITAFIVVALLSKLLGGLGSLSCGGLGIACPPGVNGYSTLFTGYSQPDYSHYSQHDYHPFQHFSRSFDSSKAGLLDYLSRSIDIMDVSFSIFGIEEEACKRKFVCMADNEALQNPFFEIALKLLGSNLEKYRDFSYNRSKYKNCGKLYPECKRKLPIEEINDFNNSIDETRKNIHEELSEMNQTSLT